MIPFVGRVRGLRGWYTSLSGDQNQRCDRLTLRRPNARSLSGLQGIGLTVDMFYYHTVGPNWAVRIAGDQRPRRTGTA